MKSDKNGKIGKKRNNPTVFKEGNPGGPGRSKGSKSLGTTIKSLYEQASNGEIDMEIAVREAMGIMIDAMRNHPQEKVRFDFAKEIVRASPKFTYLNLGDVPEFHTLKDISAFNKKLTKAAGTGKVALEKAKAYKDLLKEDRDVLRDEISEEMLKRDS